MSVFCWGRGEDGQLGLGDTTDQLKPVIVDSLKDSHIVQIACGSGHTVVLTDDGEVFTWGRGDDGRLGHGDHGWKYIPRPVENLSDVVVKFITCGSYHTAAVTENGELYTWGGGMYGKLGHGNELGSTVPQRVESLSNYRVKQISCGSRHTVVLLQNGDVYSWGDRENGILGHGNTEGHQYEPCVVPAIKDKHIRQIAVCGFHSCALSERGVLYTWGEGKFGRLGHGNEGNEVTPKMVMALEHHKVAQISCGGFHTAAITDLGEVFTWGGGEHGQLGHGNKVNQKLPCLVQLLVGKMVVQIVCGWSHTVSLTDEGELYSWGNGDHGKLGHGDVGKVTSPELVKALVGRQIVQIASYNEHTSALTNSSDKKSLLSRARLSADLKQLIDNEEFSDIAFIVEGRPIYSHRAIIAIRSEHFRAMFRSGMRETREAQIVVPNIRIATFVSLLEYIYTDEVDVDAEHAIEVFAAADLYALPKLMELCEYALKRGLTASNASKLFRLADAEQSSQPLRRMCLEYIVKDFDVVSKMDAFSELSREQNVLLAPIQIVEILHSRPT